LFFHPNDKWGFISLANSGSTHGENGERIIAEELANFARDIAVGISKTASRKAEEYQLLPNYPNPFNPSTKIKFDLPKSEFINLKVYNILGEEIAIVVSNKLQAGNHTYEFDGSNLSSGIYFYRIEAGEFQDVKKMILLK
jgi:hypothetical protein